MTESDIAPATPDPQRAAESAAKRAAETAAQRGESTAQRGETAAQREQSPPSVRSCSCAAS